MEKAATGAARGEPVERFRPTAGLFVGWTGLVLAGLAIAYVLAFERSPGGLRFALGAAFLAAVVWATQLRPRATAYTEELVIHGSVHDTAIPYVTIGDVSMGQTLTVIADGRRFVCVGIGRSLGSEARQRLRSHGQSGLLGPKSAARYTGAAEAVPRQPSTSYQDFVLTRIEELVAAARTRAHRTGDEERPDVRTTYAVPELVALVATGLAFVVSLLLR
jgi:hypothetical protein